MKVLPLSLMVFVRLVAMVTIRCLWGEGVSIFKFANCHRITAGWLNFLCPETERGCLTSEEFYFYFSRLLALLEQEAIL